MAPVQCRERHGQLHRPRLPRRGRRLEAVHRRALAEPPPGVGVVAAREQVGDRPADRLRRREAEDALGRGVPALDAILRRDGDDGVAGGGDELLERSLGVGDLPIQPRVPERDGQVLGQHLEELALPRIDRAPGRAIVDDEVPERPLAIVDGARHGRGVGRIEVDRQLGDDRDTVVAERGPDLLGDRGRYPLRIELSDDRAGDLA